MNRRIVVNDYWKIMRQYQTWTAVNMMPWDTQMPLSLETGSTASSDQPTQFTEWYIFAGLSPIYNSGAG